jgi:prepilin-type processing-associated H-X9-DG protein
MDFLRVERVAGLRVCNPAFPKFSSIIYADQNHMKIHYIPKHASSAAFTLTELLVIIVIIITLVAFGFSGLSKMRKAGDKVAATRSLAQVQLANAGYAADNNGQFVPIYAFDDKGATYTHWYRRADFLGYLKGESSVYYPNGNVNWSLPTNMLDPVAVRAKKESYNTMDGSFGYNANGLPSGWGKPNGAPAFRTSQLTSPERSAAFMTATDWNVSYASRFKWQSTPTEGLSRDQKMAYRHSGKALVAYYDGHIGEVSIADLKKIDGEGGANHIFWKGDAK